MTGDPAILVDGLVKEFGPSRAVDGLSFSVARGSIFGLLGPNGAGKTTTLRILTTLIRPTSGRARVAGFDVQREPLEVRRRIVVVIQESAVDLFLSVRDNLLTFGRFHGLSAAAARTRAADVMERFGLAGEAHRKVLDLSGGFRRRVQVAKAFMVDAPVLFLDEFSTGMDPILKRSMMAALREQAAAGRTIVLTTQILSEAEELCDDILILNRGREIARGNLAALKLLTENVYEVTMTFDALPAGLEAELAARRPLRLSVSGTTIAITLKEDETRVLALVSSLAERARVLRVEVSGASLEDLFPPRCARWATRTPSRGTPTSCATRRWASGNRRQLPRRRPRFNCSARCPSPRRCGCSAGRSDGARPGAPRVCATAASVAAHSGTTGVARAFRLAPLDGLGTP